MITDKAKENGSHTCDEAKEPIHVGRFDRFEVEAVNAFILVICT